MSVQPKKYLFWFAQEHLNFRSAEIDSILNMYDILPTKFKIIKKTDHSPFWIVESTSEAIIKKITSRSISMKFSMELWAYGEEYKEFHNLLENYAKDNLTNWEDKEKSFKIVVETFCKHLSQKEKIERIESFSYLPLEGPVNLNDPEVTLYYIEYYGIEPNNIPDEPKDLFFGRLVSKSLRELIPKLSLKTRKFIGTTSMDPQLSLLMANQAQVKNADIILDPFVGTGSLLVAAAQFGGFILGSDIDFMMLHGRTRPTRISQKKRCSDESVAANIKQYGKSSYYLDVVVSDFSRPIWRPEMRIDAIITDPPYGVREATERVGTTKSNSLIEIHQASTHIPSKIDYNLPHIFRDLLKFAAQSLEINGRLVCWFPVYRENYSENQLPSHPCLKLIANSEQVLSIYASRRLLTYTKTREPKESDTIDTKNILDFREMYFALRNETRREKRLKETEERARNKAEWEKKNKENTDR